MCCQWHCIVTSLSLHLDKVLNEPGKGQQDILEHHWMKVTRLAFPRDGQHRGNNLHCQINPSRQNVTLRAAVRTEKSYGMRPADVAQHSPPTPSLRRHCCAHRCISVDIPYRQAEHLPLRKLSIDPGLYIAETRFKRDRNVPNGFTCLVTTEPCNYYKPRRLSTRRCL
jgi:hypothetical protein